MNDIKCPSCGKLFQIDDASYAAIQKQVHDREFSQQVDQRVKLEVQAVVTQRDKEHETQRAAEKKKTEEGFKMRDDEIAALKDYQVKRSTKMVGESLEQYCETEFEKIRAAAFQGAYFKKDSDTKLGSKGDYIFKDFDSDGNEYISIMFEMKNESKETEKKMKNKSFLKELDKDRNEKKCEWAVLVSTLESDNEIYDGITDMSHEYPKMFVVRPHEFISIISILRNAARTNIDTKMELVRAQQENIDVTKILDKVDQFKSKFSKNLGAGQKKSDQVIIEIDKAIKALENAKNDLQTTYLYLSKADSDLDDLINITLPLNKPKEING